MRGYTTLAEVVPRGEKTLSLKARALLVEGDDYELYTELWIARRETQRIIDALWELDRLPTISQAHQMFYKSLREKGFRAHQAKQMYKYALALVKASRRVNGSKPVLKRLSARLDKYDASIDFDEWIVTVKLRNKTFRLKLLNSMSYIEKYRGRKRKEVIFKRLTSVNIDVVIPFRFEYEPYEPRSVLALDINLKQLTLYDGTRVRRLKTRYIEALRLKHLAEYVQRRHPYSWRRSEKLRELVGSLHRRGRRVVLDWSRKTAKYIVTVAKRIGAAIAVEDLERLWHNASRKTARLADALSRFAYRRLLDAIITKAVEYNVPVILVDPRDTSRTCPRCGAKLVYWHRLGVCPVCGFTADRDTIGAMNIWLRAFEPRAPSPGVWGHPGR